MTEEEAGAAKRRRVFIFSGESEASLAPIQTQTAQQALNSSLKRLLNSFLDQFFGSELKQEIKLPRLSGSKRYLSEAEMRLMHFFFLCSK